jgi:hypothetical protein
MEGAARALAGRYDRVLVRAKNALFHRIRLRRSKLADLKPYITLNPAAFDAQLDAWNEAGGMLIYNRDYRREENIDAHHAQLVCECPLSVDAVTKFTEKTREILVIYRPPNWREYDRRVNDLYPDASICMRFYEIIRASKKQDGFHVVSDESMREALNVTSPQLFRIRKATFLARDYRMVIQVIPRIEPVDSTLVGVYNWILRECADANGVRMIEGTSLSKAVKHWNVALKALVRCGAIARKDTLFFYHLSELDPDWEKIDTTRNAAQTNLREVIKMVEKSEEFNLPASTSPRSPEGKRQSQSSPA